MTAASADPQTVLSPAGRIRLLVVLCLSTVAMAADLIMLFRAIRSTMDIHGSCSDGGPYLVTRACPEAAGGVLAVGLPGLFVAGILMWYAAARLRAPQVALLAWPGLFLPMAWNFIEFGIRERIDITLLFCGILMLLFGGIPVILAARTRTKWRQKGAPEPRTHLRLYLVLAAVGLAGGHLWYSSLATPS